MDQITSFTVDHTKLVPGLYYSRRDGDVVTFDLRFKRPNTGDLLTNSEMHSTELLIATLLHHSEDKEAVPSTLVPWAARPASTFCLTIGCCLWRGPLSC